MTGKVSITKKGVRIDGAKLLFLMWVYIGISFVLSAAYETVHEGLDTGVPYLISAAILFAVLARDKFLLEDSGFEAVKHNIFFIVITLGIFLITLWVNISEYLL